MLSKEPFSNSELQVIEAIPKGFKTILLFYLIVCVPSSLLFGFFGLLKKGHGYWLTAIPLLAVMSAAFLFVILKEYIAYKKDLKAKIKLSGKFTVKKKSSEKETYIYTDIKEFKKFNLRDKNVFDKIEIGDELNFEISMFSKIIFRLEKGGEILIKK